MSLTGEILRSYTRPRAVMRRLMGAVGADPRPEARGFIYLLLGCLVIYLSQVPELINQPVQTGEDAAPREARLAITFFGWLFVWPLILYLLAGGSHLVARGFGARGQGVYARLALFWAVLVVSPLFLLRALGLLAGSAGAQLMIGGGIAVAFFAIWLLCLYEAEWGQRG